MSAFKQNMRKLGIRAGLLAGTSLAVVAIAGVGAGSASAACTGTIEGQGSSLQKIAQESIWIPGYTGAGVECNGHATPKYTSSGSGAGLEAWGFTGSGSVNHTWAYIGTDDGPSETQITSAKTAAGAGSHVVVVPVAQTAIAILVHPPANCGFSEVEEKGITNKNLEKAFDGEATTWSAIGAEGTGCSGSLTRVVRKDASGTTFQLKAYLAKVNTLIHTTEAAPCAGQKKWSELEEVPTKNLEWPECGTIAVTRPTGTGGGEVAAKVAATTGTIGYAALPDAKAKGASTVRVQNNGISGSPIYALPNAGEEEANCTKAEYTVPTGANKKLSGTGIDVNWSQVFGGKPNIGGEIYPVCTLTYDLAWENYETAGFGAGETVGASVKNYYEYIVSHGTGSGSKKKWYANLPEKTGSEEEHNVKLAAEFSLGKIVK